MGTLGTDSYLKYVRVWCGLCLVDCPGWFAVPYTTSSQVSILFHLVATHLLLSRPSRPNLYMASIFHLLSTLALGVIPIAFFVGGLDYPDSNGSKVGSPQFY